MPTTYIDPAKFSLGINWASVLFLKFILLQCCIFSLITGFQLRLNPFLTYNPLTCSRRVSYTRSYFSLNVWFLVKFVFLSKLFVVLQAHILYSFWIYYFKFNFLLFCRITTEIESIPDVHPFDMLRTRAFYTLWFLFLVNGQSVIFISTLYKVYNSFKRQVLLCIIYMVHNG